MPAASAGLSGAPAGGATSSGTIAGARLEALAPRGVRPGLATIAELLRALGAPQAAMPVVLVAGTDGKGSTAALLAAMARAAGYRAGRFTSPALVDPCEQIEVDGTAIADGALAARLDAVMALAERLRPGALTAFEALTAAAFAHFAAERVALAVVEVGMGGRDDATNVAEPALAVITTVGDDHADALGPSRAAIATAKAGILRPGRPAAIGWLDAEAEAAVRAHAEAIGARPRFARQAVHALERRPQGLAGQEVAVATDRGRYRFDLPLAGAHQARNLALATLAAEMLADGTLDGGGFPRLDRAAIVAGAAACRWPGRMELLAMPGGRRVLLDGAHTVTGAAALAAALAEAGHGPNRRYDLLFGVYRDKDPAGMLARLAPAARRVILTRPSGPRGWDPEAWLADRPREPAFSHSDWQVEPELEAALEREVLGVADGAKEDDALLVVCGSLALVGRARAWLLALGAEAVDAGTP